MEQTQDSGQNPTEDTILQNPKNLYSQMHYAILGTL
jgi:hypothetical protein